MLRKEYYFMMLLWFVQLSMQASNVKLSEKALHFRLA